MKVGIVGCGVMGSAMARILRKDHKVFLYTRAPEKIQELAQEIQAKICGSLEELSESCEVLILAVKPKGLEEIAEELDPVMKKGMLLLSILVGTTMTQLREVFSNPRVFRLMPNLPLLCGKGLIGVADQEEDPPEEKEKVQQILKGLGKVVWLEEKMMNPFAALTGSSPAFVCMILEAMIQAGVTVGFRVDQAETLILKMVEGTIALLRHTGSRPEEIADAVASPGGTTIAGLNEMERLNVRHGVIRGILATLEKGKAMEE